MRVALVTLAVVWGGSLAAIAVGVAWMWLAGTRSARPADRGGRVEAWSSSRGRAIEPDPGLLVPWSAVRSSRRRLELCEEEVTRAALESSPHDPTPGISPDREVAVPLRPAV